MKRIVDCFEQLKKSGACSKNDTRNFIGTKVKEDGTHYGKISFGKDEYYIGELLRYIPSGHGMVKESDSVYIGSFMYGKKNGIGTMKSGNTTWKGNWVFGHLHGIALECNQKKNRYYISEWKLGKRNGSCVKITDGRIYSGFYNNDELQNEEVIGRYQLEVEKKVLVKECVVCCENTVDIAFVPCGHFCCCQNCSVRLQECPICRVKIQIAQKIYIS